MIGTDGITTRRAACECVTEVRVWVLDASFTRKDNPTLGSVIRTLYIAPLKICRLTSHDNEREDNDFEER